MNIYLTHHFTWIEVILLTKMCPFAFATGVPGKLAGKGVPRDYQWPFCNATNVSLSPMYRKAKYVGYQKPIFIEKSSQCIIVTVQMYMKLAVGGVVLFLMGILLTLPSFEINSVVQVRIVPPLLVGIFSGTFGLVAAMIGFCTPLWDYLFPSET